MTSWMHENPSDRAGSASEESRHSRHRWMMILCVTTLVLAVALVATGTASISFVLIAIGCTAMMWLMMRGMSNT